DLLDARTGNLLWRRDRFPIESFEPPVVHPTKAHGDLLIVKSENTYLALRKSDGKNAWAVRAESEKASTLANDRLLFVFEPEHRIRAVDLETGETVSEVKIQQYFDA